MVGLICQLGWLNFVLNLFPAVWNLYLKHRCKKEFLQVVGKKPVHEKEDKNLLKNYKPFSLLPIFGKIFERVLFKDLFNYFHKNQLFTKCQSGFLPGDSCISHRLSIAHNINSFFDCDPTIDVRGVFLDISEAFDKVLNDGIILRL